MEEKSPRTSIAVVVSFFTVLAAIFLLAYWSAFDIAVLEFADLSDVLKLALYPALGSFLLFGLAIAVAQLFERDQPPPKHDAETAAKLMRRAERNLRIMALAASFLLLVALTLAPEPIKWLLVAILAALSSMPIAQKFIPKPWIGDNRMRNLLIVGVLMAPGIALTFGREHAYQIKTGNAETLVDLARSQLPLTGDAERPVAYLGHIGEFFVFYETSTRSTVLISAKEQPKLFLQHNPRHVTRPFG